MENTIIVLDDKNKNMVERVAKKVGKEIYADSIDINGLLDLLSDLEDKCDDTEYDLDHLQEEFDDYKDTIADNYREISPYEMYGVSPNDFH